MSGAPLLYSRQHHLWIVGRLSETSSQAALAVMWGKAGRPSLQESGLPVGKTLKKRLSAALILSSSRQRDKKKDT